MSTCGALAWSMDRGDLAQARAHPILAAALPSLRVARLPFLGLGFNHDVSAGHEAPVFRFPRRTDALASQAAEDTALTRLADRLPVQVPNIVHPCGPVAGFPHPFFGRRRVVGVPGDSIELDLPARAALAARAHRAFVTSG